MLDGSLYGRVRVRCDRCLEPYIQDLDFDFRSILERLHSDPVQSELELSAEDLSVNFTVGDEIDLHEIVREQLYLSLPMKLLCNKKCYGLCPMCGTNLNKKKCGCHMEKGHPEFSKLKNL